MCVGVVLEFNEYILCCSAIFSPYLTSVAGSVGGSFSAALISVLCGREWYFSVVIVNLSVYIHVYSACFFIVFIFCYVFLVTDFFIFSSKFSLVWFFFVILVLCFTPFFYLITVHMNFQFLHSIVVFSVHQFNPFLPCFLSSALLLRS